MAESEVEGRDRELHQVASDRLASIDQRYTRGRRELVGALERATNPLTVEQILLTATSVPQSSAYRNLVVLEDAAIVHRIVTSDDYARFELTEDLTEHHHHIICSECGNVVDFTLPGAVESEVDKALNAAARKIGFSGDHHRLDLVGTCADCR